MLLRLIGCCSSALKLTGRPLMNLVSSGGLTDWTTPAVCHSAPPTALHLFTPYMGILVWLRPLPSCAPPHLNGTCSVLPRLRPAVSQVSVYLWLFWPVTGGTLSGLSLCRAPPVFQLWDPQRPPVEEGGSRNAPVFHLQRPTAEPAAAAAQEESGEVTPTGYCRNRSNWGRIQSLLLEL